MSPPTTSIHNTWRIRGVVQDYLIVRASHAAELTEERIAPVFLEASMDRWLASLYTRRIVHELYELVEGPLGPSSPPHSQHRLHEQIKRRLREAFRHGELVAYANGPARLKQSISGGTGGGGSAPMPVPLLADRPEQAPSQEQEKPQEQTERTRVDILLVDEDDTPLAGVRYRLTLPDGSMREGQLDDQGAAREEDIDPGMCVLVFPELDGEDA